MAQAPPRGSRRTKVAPVKKPFPWGFAAGCTVLAVALVAVLVYAVQNTGSGFETATDKVDKTFSGLQVTKNASFTHVTGRVSYPHSATEPPDSGNHNQYPQACQVYDKPIVNEHAVHSLEHGAVWITYRPDLPATQVTTLKTLVEANPSFRMLSPYPGQTSPVSLQAWGRRLAVGSAGDAQVAKFADAYTSGPQSREKGASCAGVNLPGTSLFTLAADGKTFIPENGSAGPAPSGEASPSVAPSP